MWFPQEIFWCSPLSNLMTRWRYNSISCRTAYPRTAVFPLCHRQGMRRIYSAFCSSIRIWIISLSLSRSVQTCHGNPDDHAWCSLGLQNRILSLRTCIGSIRAMRPRERLSCITNLSRSLKSTVNRRHRATSFSWCSPVPGFRFWCSRCWPWRSWRYARSISCGSDSRRSSFRSFTSRRWRKNSLTDIHRRHWRSVRWIFSATDRWRYLSIGNRVYRRRWFSLWVILA